jgi:hypothetical protein
MDPCPHPIPWQTTEAIGMTVNNIPQTGCDGDLKARSFAATNFFLLSNLENSRPKHTGSNARRRSMNIGSCSESLGAKIRHWSSARQRRHSPGCQQSRPDTTPILITPTQKARQVIVFSWLSPTYTAGGLKCLLEMKSATETRDQGVRRQEAWVVSVLTGAASKAADLGGERPLLRTASISDAREVTNRVLSGYNRHGHPAHLVAAVGTTWVAANSEVSSVKSLSENIVAVPTHWSNGEGRRDRGRNGEALCQPPR